MRYLMVDRILEWEAGRGIKGVKNVAMSEDVLEFHFPGNPIMPGVLLLEAMVQLAGWIEAASTDFQRWFLLQRIPRCHFYGFALPGDQVEFEIKALESPDASSKKFEGIGTVNGKKKIVAEFEGESVLLEDLESATEQRRLFEILTRS
ncbi:MAG: beta-hydroxyacyl-ACP dehydratase [Nitrospirae bacterium]|nr:beta-hydroxyacyl-ACP dehydratase [Nitrospirota bacterium]